VCFFSILYILIIFAAGNFYFYACRNCEAEQRSNPAFTVFLDFYAELALRAAVASGLRPRNDVLLTFNF
jgi:hypothetical protein